MKKFLIGLALILFLISNSYAWTEKPFVAEWDGSTYWSSDFTEEENEKYPNGKPTDDLTIHTWDNKIKNDPNTQFHFMTGRAISISAIIQDGAIQWWTVMPPEIELIFPNEIKYTKEIIKDILLELNNEFPGELFSVAYFPQYDSISIYVHPNRMEDKEYNKKVADYLNSLRNKKLKEGKRIKYIDPNHKS